MDLKWLLVKRIALVALASLVAASAFAVYRTAQAEMRKNTELIELVSRQLNLQLSRIKRATDLPERFPDWDLIGGLSLQPGQCIELRGVLAPQQLRRSSCSGFDLTSLHAPQWFRWISDWLAIGEKSVTRTVSFQGQDHATVTIENNPIVTAERAWETVAPLLTFAAVLVSSLCVVTYFVILGALRPSTEILSGLNRLARGDLSYRLPAFRLAELNRIGQAFNVVSEDLDKARTERAELARRLVDMQEQERRHLARELHDEIGQKLAAQNALAACIRRSAQTEAPSLGDEARELEKMTSELMVSLRRTLTYLRPQEIDDLGLLQSLKGLVDRHNEEARGRTSYSIEATEGIEQLNPETSAHVYRIVQEALTNASKHANARQVRVSLAQLAELDQQRIRLSIVDDGVGPPRVSKPPALAGAGLIGMRERVTALSGKLVAGPLPTGGFGLQVEFPASPHGA